MIKSFKLGPGTLTLDPGGAALEVSAQITNGRIEWSESVNSTDPIPVLSGEELPGEDEVTYAATLAGNVVQDIDAAGLVAWSWTHKGETVNFTFVPSTTDGREVTGTVRVIPLTLGGDVNTRNQSDFTWTCPSDPVLGDVA